MSHIPKFKNAKLNHFISWSNDGVLWVANYGGMHLPAKRANPTEKLLDYIKKHMIYGYRGELNNNYYLEIMQRPNAETVLYLKYQQIIGSHCVCSFDLSQLDDIEELATFYQVDLTSNTGTMTEYISSAKRIEDVREDAAQNARSYGASCEVKEINLNEFLEGNKISLQKYKEAL